MVGHTHPGWNSARELGTVVYDPFRSLSQCPAPSPRGDPVVEPGRSPWLWAVEITRRIDEEWQTERREGREGGREGRKKGGRGGRK